MNEKYPLLFKSQENNIDLEKHYRKAWQQAKKAAKILKSEYGAEKVWVFGSLTDKERFHKRSDIDLAARGIPDSRFYAAVAKITRNIKDFKVDLVDEGDCRQGIKECIKKEGIQI
ncbi:MAG: nucleotidyltransferase family protein [Halanaerobiales bacterium]